MNQQQRAYCYGLGAVILWSTVATAFKVALTFFTPLQLVLVSVITSIITLGLILFYQKKHTLIVGQFCKRPGFYLLTGLLNPFLYYYVLFQAYDLLPAQQALSLNYTWAILLPILAVPILGHKLSYTDILAAIIAYFGVYMIATGGQLTSFSFESPVGILLALMSTVIWCLYWMINTKDKGDPVISLLLSFVVGLPFVVVALLVIDSLPSLSLNGLLAGIYVGLFEMGITFVLWLMALKNTQKTANISTLAFLTPVISVGVISWVLQENIKTSTYLGLALILAGLALQQIIPRVFAVKKIPPIEKI